MIELVITDRIHQKIPVGENPTRLISLRPLTQNEVALARNLGIGRFYLPTLTKVQSAQFYKEFDRFWDQVVRPFGADHPFWRNVASSKMQEWEMSVSYLALVLFTICRMKTRNPQFIVILCGSIDEEDVCERWGKGKGWTVHRRPHSPLPQWCRRIVREALNFKRFCHMFSLCLYQKWLFRGYRPRSTDTDAPILVASLFYSSSFKNGGYEDPFFDSLHKVHHRNGESLTYLSSPLGDFRDSARKIRDCREVSVLVPHSVITWPQLIRLASQVFLRRFRFLHTDFCGCDFSNLLKWTARRFHHIFNLHAEICYAAVKRLCERDHFERLIQLYEGNVFERGCIQAFRKYGSGPIVGYSHAVVFPLNLKIRLSHHERHLKPEPDFLLSTGPESTRSMERIGGRESTRIYSGCTLRYIPAKENGKRAETGEANILLALDGVRASASVLDWMIECAEMLRGYKITVRAHPNMPVGPLISQCLHDVPGNFHLSEADLKTDIAACFCVIYRQTSVGMQAWMNGVPAIHLQVDAPLPCDPIMGLKSSPWRVRTPLELFRALQEIQHLGEERRRRLIASAQRYSRDYFKPPDDRNIEGFFMVGAR